MKNGRRSSLSSRETTQIQKLIVIKKQTAWKAGNVGKRLVKNKARKKMTNSKTKKCRTADHTLPSLPVLSGICYHHNKGRNHSLMFSY